MQERVTAKRPKMVRKQLLISPEQNRQIGRVAAAQGRSESEIVRDAIDTWLPTATEGEDGWKAAWLGTAGIWRDRTDIDDLLKKRRSQRRARRQRLIRADRRDTARK